jgi:8-oxo-dGTP diphosphatase
MERHTYLPHIAYDSVIFGFSGSGLMVLIMEYHNTSLFALPGGFVDRDEDLDEAVRRGLHERTGLANIYLEQFYTFGSVKRYQPDIMRRILAANAHSANAGHWLLDRFISVGYYALIDHRSVTPTPDALSDSCTWYPLENLPELMLDHREMVLKAVQTLRENIDRKMLTVNLLPEQFTMQELQKVYESILGIPLRRTSFQRKMLAMDVLIRHEKRFSGKAHKAPYLYSFKHSG